MSANTDDRLTELLDDLRTTSGGERRTVINKIVILCQPILRKQQRSLAAHAPLLDWDDVLAEANLGILEALHERAAKGESGPVISNGPGWLVRIAKYAVIGHDSTPAATGGVTSTTRLRKQRFTFGQVAPALFQQLQREPTRRELLEAANAAWRGQRAEGSAVKNGKIAAADLESPVLKSTDGFELEDRGQLDPLEQLIEREDREEQAALAKRQLAAVPDNVWPIIRERFGYEPRSGRYSRLTDPKPFREVAGVVGQTSNRASRRVREARELILAG